MNVLLFVFLSTLLGANCAEVRIRDGPIEGTTARTRSGRLFHKFMRVPYARPPVGELRLKPPVPPVPWTEKKDATKPPPSCIQFLTATNGLVEGQEDCLYLNVYVPDELFNNTQRNPVIVGIHGGGFRTGSSNDYQPDYLMERDVILVSINYRLGTLGFYASNNEHISGNFGLKDQSLALKWVNENIALFGGDPQNVTIQGESAGAASVHLHMFSPLSKGLFQKAIAESGSAYARWANLETFVQSQIRIVFLISAGCASLDPQTTLPCLQSKKAEDFVTKYDSLFLPIVEDHQNIKEPFLPNKPNLTNYVTQVPMLHGINSGEGALVMMSLLQNGDDALCRKVPLIGDKTTCIKAINKHKYFFIPIMNLYHPLIHPPLTTTIINEFYFGAEDLGLETALEAVNMITDSAFFYPFMKSVESYVNQPSLKQYVYLYDHRGSFSLQDSANLTIDLGVCHADEVPLLYRNEKLEAKRTLQDKRVSEKLLKYWINFAISEDPNRHSVEKIWQPVSTYNNIEYLHITSDNVTMEKNLYADRYQLWCSLNLGWLPCLSH